MLVVVASLIERTFSQDKNCNTNTTMLSSTLISQSNPTPKTKQIKLEKIINNRHLTWSTCLATCIQLQHLGVRIRTKNQNNQKSI